MTINEYKIVDETQRLDRTRLKPNKPEWIIFHSTGIRENFEKVHNLHTSYGWAGVGYHYFLDHRGVLSQARPIELEGAHSLGFNFRSVGVCVYSPKDHIGENQVDCLVWLMQQLNEVTKLQPMSHTFSQIQYFNKLFTDRGIQASIDCKEEPHDAEIFMRLQTQIKSIASSLRVKHPGVAKDLDCFKRCPHGEIYDQIRKRIRGHY